MYRVLLRRTAQKGLRDLSAGRQRSMAQALGALGENPRTIGCKKLEAGLGWSLRIGGHRIIYDIDDDAQTVDVLFIGPRGAAYRKF